MRRMGWADLHNLLTTKGGDWSYWDDYSIRNQVHEDLRDCLDELPRNITIRNRRGHQVDPYTEAPGHSIRVLSEDDAQRLADFTSGSVVVRVDGGVSLRMGGQNLLLPNTRVASKKPINAQIWMAVQ